MNKFINDRNYYFNVFYDFSTYSLDFEKAGYRTQGIWLNLVKLMGKTDGRLVDRWGRKIDDEKAAEYLNIPLEEFNPVLKKFEEWRVFQRDEDGVLCNPWGIKETQEQGAKLERNRLKSQKYRDKERLSNNNSERNQYVTPKSRVEKSRKEEKREEDKRESREESAAASDDPPPVDNSTYSDSDSDSLSLSYKDSSYRSEIEALANLIETTTTAGECNGIGESVRRQAIYYQSEAFPDT